MAAPGRTWNDDEVQALLVTCTDASIQKQLLDAVRNTTENVCAKLFHTTGTFETLVYVIDGNHRLLRRSGYFSW